MKAKLHKAQIYIGHVVLISYIGNKSFGTSFTYNNMY